MVERLSADEVLQLWERAERLGPTDRALVLLARARRGRPEAEIEGMSIGQSEAALLELRQATFGGSLVALENCPDCRAFVELTVEPSVLLSMAPSTVGVTTLSVDGWRVRFRVPRLVDLRAIEEEADPSRARLLLLGRCLQEVFDPSGEPVAVEQLPASLHEPIARAMDEADPLAQLTLPLECPSCRRAWDGELDVASFFWREISVLARRLLGEVHELASRYGWSESHILRLTEVRRHAYLEGRWA
ncbi:MAG TPA: hypothetical protein VKZ18_00570 [Polyangia bacterium]|nr:hypothetical protein [Polyangia bacterium]